ARDVEAATSSTSTPSAARRTSSCGAASAEIRGVILVGAGAGRGATSAVVDGPPQPANANATRTAENRRAECGVMRGVVAEGVYFGLRTPDSGLRTAYCVLR